ncbi:MAG: AAA family ATPase [Bacteroidaceae bacterium]|nr:AAA family ATPase [Bacteroidaceae bacterium]
MANDFIQKTRIKFICYDTDKIIGTDSNGKRTVVGMPQAWCYKSLPSLLYEGCTLNILSAVVDEQGTLRPRDIILQPDYLIDISALSRCVQSYGSPAIGYILNMLEQSEESAARLLGEAANMFLDDCVNSTAPHGATYKNSILRFFAEYPLPLSVCKDIDNKFFAQAQEQFYNIQAKMGGQGFNATGYYNRDNVHLEPSFFCESLGLQGRIDLLQSDCSKLIELKSGKADEYRRTSKEEHKLQMSLYKEMLCYNMGMERSDIKAYLFYSRYPLFLGDESSATDISNALMLRNRIMALLRCMCNDGLLSTLRNTTADDLNELNTTSRLWTNYQRPRIEKILTPIKKADKLLCQYVFGHMAFVVREMMHAKASDNPRNNGRCFADVWRLSTEEKIENGNIMLGLSIKETTEKEGITDITFNIEQRSENFFPNFRVGDTVFMYRRDKDSDNATNSIVTRGTIGMLSPTSVTLHLRHKQGNSTLFSRRGSYAIEHDHLDSTFRTSLHNLYSLLTAPEQRIGLLLGSSEPQTDNTRTLRGDYGNEYINHIVLKAKRAKELFMLVGPPGTGKTSQALRCMVQEFHADGNNILLASYTNRAVDEICQTLERITPTLQYIRVGSEQNCSADYRHRLLKNSIAQCKNREQIRCKLNDTTIFVGTTASLTGNKELFAIKKFDVAIIDEATQILESQLAGLLSVVTPQGVSAIDKFILIGDPKQLPAVVAQPSSESIVTDEALRSIGLHDYATSLFERFYATYHHNSNLTATLHKQGRMHPDVCRFANRHFYGNELQPIPLPHQTEEQEYAIYDCNDPTESILATRRVAFIATEKPSTTAGKTNANEAKAIAKFISAYYRLCTKNGKQCNPSSEVGVIVPFRNQIAMVMQAIEAENIPHSKDIIIDTVERFQGSQREMILYGTTVTKKDMLDALSSPTHDADGTLIDRKLNVALTRARRRMYIFGNVQTLSASPIYNSLMQEFCVS